jgi:hypothetical protein
MSLWLADLCEAFPGRFPSEVMAEVDRLPVGLLSDVLEARAYRQAKQMREAAEQSSNPSEAIKALPKSRMFDLVAEIDYWLANGGDDE